MKTSTASRVPQVPADLLEYLEKVFPPAVPLSPNFGLEELRTHQGQQSVVQLLRRHFDSQNTTVLNR